MRNHTLLLMVTSFTLSCVTSADSDIKSKLFIQQDTSPTVSEQKNNSNNVDFFKLAKKHEPVIPTPNWDAPSMANMSENERSQYMSNMSAYERSQYQLNQNSYSTLNNSVNQQRIDTLRNERDNGKISNKQYQREVQNLKIYNQHKSPNSVGFSIPLE